LKWHKQLLEYFKYFHQYYAEGSNACNVVAEQNQHTIGFS